MIISIKRKYLNIWYIYKKIMKPKRLQKGDTIGIIAPANTASVINRTPWNTGIKKLQSKGFKLIFGKHINKIYGHTAGTVRERTEDLMDMFKNKEVKTVICVYGGYNSHQLLPYIDYNIIKKNPKIFIGFSDITSLNNAIYAKTGLINFSGPAFITFCQPELPEFTEKYFDEILIEAKDKTVIKPSKEWADDEWWKKPNFGPREWKKNPGFVVLKEGIGKGIAIGGNIGTLLLLAGTEYFPNMKGKILFVEDDDVESPKTLDRFFTQLRHLGIYDKINGLVIGRFPSKVSLTKEDSLKMIIDEATKGYNFPIISEVDFSHTDPLITIPIGIKCKIDTADKEIKFLEKAVV